MSDLSPMSDERVNLSRMQPVQPDAADPSAYDYGSDADPDGKVVAQAFAELDRLTLAAERAIEARKRAEEALQRAKDVERQLIERDIPELLEKMRLDKCTTSSGIEVSVKREIRASLPGMERVDDRLRAFQWLLDGGNGGVIKNKVIVELDRGKDERADQLVVELRAQGFEPQSYKDVHPMTLSALVRELVAAGKIVPRDCLNVFDDRKAKLTRKDA